MGSEAVGNDPGLPLRRYFLDDDDQQVDHDNRPLDMTENDRLPHTMEAYLPSRDPPQLELSRSVYYTSANVE